MPAASRSQKAPSRRQSTRRRRGRGTAILHTCGHTQKHALPSLKWKKDRDTARLSSQPCTACWGASKAEEVEALCGVANLPPLKGTVRQVVWGRTIRGTHLIRLSTLGHKLIRLNEEAGMPEASDPVLALALDQALAQQRAKWWIDHKDDPEALDLLLPREAQKALDSLRREVETRTAERVATTFARTRERFNLPDPAETCPF